MSELFDQFFRIDFVLEARVSGGAPLSDNTPSSVMMAQSYTGYIRYTIDRTINIINDNKSYTRKLINRITNSTSTWAPVVWSNGATGPNIVDHVSFSDTNNASSGYRCELLFGDLNMPLTDEMINKINDTTSVFSLTTNVGDQRVTLKSFDKFRTEKTIIRKTYDYLGRQRSSRASALLTTDATLEIPIELELTVARSTAGGKETYTYKPTQNVYTIKSTGETTTIW